MIIDPYNVSGIKQEKIKEKDKNDIIENSINFLITNHKEIIENRKEDIIRKVLDKYYFSQNIKLNSVTMEGIIKEISNKLFGYGVLQQYIEDKSTTDIRAVAYNKIYVKKLGKWEKTNSCFETEEQFNEFIRYAILKNGGNINYERPIVVVSDKTSHLRIEAGIDPVNVQASSIVIRIHKDNESKNLETLFAKDNMLRKEEYVFLQGAVQNLKNILIVGKGGSGKTTLLRAMISKLPENIAICTNEETAELYIENRNIIQREVLIRKTDEQSIDLERLTRHSLVMSNDVIIIGELKGKEASMFFDAISTGHVGYTTIHADSVENSIDRLIVLIKKDIKAQGYTDAFLRRFIISSIDYVVYMKDYKIQEIAALVYDERENKISKQTVCLDDKDG